MTKENSGYSPILRFIVANMVPRTLYRLHLDQGVGQKIKDTKKILDAHPEYSYVVGQNHQTEDDPIFGGHIAYKIDPSGNRHVIAPVSAHHTQSGDKKKSKMNQLAKTCGVETLPVIQTYQVDNPNYSYTRQDAFKNYKSFISRINDLKEKKGSLGCIITPEGHRSPDGILGKGEKGIIKIIEKIQPTVLIPLAIYSPDQLEIDKKNFGKRINLNIGEIIIVKEGDKKISIDDFMNNLAMALPPQMRGQYGSRNNLI